MPPQLPASQSACTHLHPQITVHTTYDEIADMLERGRQYNADPSRGGGELHEEAIPTSKAAARDVHGSMGAVVGSGSYGRVFFGELWCSESRLLPQRRAPS